MIEHAFNQAKKKQTNKTKTQHNNNKRTQKRKKKNAGNCYSFTKIQADFFCLQAIFFFTKHHSKNKRKITGLSIDVSQMARLIKPQSARFSPTDHEFTNDLATTINMVGFCNQTTSDCSDREIRNPRLSCFWSAQYYWWLELNDDEIFERKRKGSLVSCQLAVERTCYRCR